MSLQHCSERNPPGRSDIAIFDLDGTLTARDTLLPYLLGFFLSNPSRWYRLIPAVWSLTMFVAGRLDRDKCKEALLRHCLSGARREEVDRHTARFASRVLSRGLNRSAVDVLNEHRADGAHLVLLSASPDVYVPAIAAGLGFHECFCTELRWSGDRLIGTFATPNRRAEEKSSLVRALRTRMSGTIAAYANSSSDLSHLRLADHPVLVNGSRRARRMARQQGIPLRDWK